MTPFNRSEKIKVKKEIGHFRSTLLHRERENIDIMTKITNKFLYFLVSKKDKVRITLTFN